MSNELELVTEIPTENSVKNRIITYLVQRGALVMRINSGAVVGTHQGKRRFFWFAKWYVAGQKEQRGGVSDILAILPGGKLLIVECKRPGKKNNVTLKQCLFITEIEKRGGMVVVASSVDDVEQAIINNSM